MKVLEQLSTILHEERDALLRDWRERVLAIPAARRLGAPALEDHMPGFVEELARAVASAGPGAREAAPGVRTPPAHAEQRFEEGFDIGQVVAEYSAMRACVHALAGRRGVVLAGPSLRVLDEVLDGAIAKAVSAFADQQVRELQRRREEYLAFVAHDLRTPLNAIALCSKGLAMAGGESARDPRAARMLETLQRNAEHLEALVANVLKENTHLVTELGLKLERRAFDVWPLVEGVVQDVAPVAAERRTRVVNEVPAELAVHADAGLVRRIFQNLLANAIAHTPLGVVRIGARAGAGHAPPECWVADNGQGIAPERLDAIFEARRSDSPGEHAGLGLAIVKSFVEAHGGRVWVESAPGQGSTFRFTLPERAGARAGAAAAP